MDVRIQLVAVFGAAVLLLFVLELVRRRRLMERYALLWLLSALVMLALSVWGGALKLLSDKLGIIYPPNALFLVAFGFVLLLLLHFSLVISRLADENKVLAQRLGLLQQRIDEVTSEHAAIRTPEASEYAAARGGTRA